MQAVSESFLRTVTTSHRAIFRVDILDAHGDVSESITSLVQGPTVTLDGTASIRSTMSFTLLDPLDRYLVRGSVNDVLSPFGSEVRLWRGVVLNDGTEEVTPLGTFRVETNDPTDDDHILSVTGKDRSSIVSRKAPRPLSIPNGTTLEAAVTRIVLHMLPTAVFDLPPTNDRVPTMLIKAGDNPWDIAVQMAAHHGYALYVDRMGVFRMDPTVPGAAVWIFGAGPRNLFTAKPSERNGRNSSVPNGFIVTSNSTGGDSSGVRGEAWDENPESPTYRYGPYGENAEHVASDKVTTTDAARRGAEMLLRRALGRVGEMTFSSVPNPALDPDDVVLVQGSRGGTGVYYLSQLTIPLEASSPMTGTMRLLADPSLPSDEDLNKLLGVSDGLDLRQLSGTPGSAGAIYGGGEDA